MQIQIIISGHHIVNSSFSIWAYGEQGKKHLTTTEMAFVKTAERCTSLEHKMDYDKKHGGDQYNE